MTPRMVRHLADAARNTDGWYMAAVPNGGGSAGVMLAQGLIEFRRGSNGPGYYLTTAGLTAVRNG